MIGFDPVRVRALAAKFALAKPPEKPRELQAKREGGTGRRALIWLTKCGPSTAPQIAKGLHIKRGLANMTMVRLAKRGKVDIVHAGSGHDDPRVYAAKVEVR